MAPLLRIAARLRLRLASIALVPAMSDDERSTVDIDDGPGRKADGHKREDLLRDILTQADTADGQGSRGLGKHVAARGLRHAGAYRRINGPGRNRIHSDGRELKRQTTREGLECAVHRTDNRSAGSRASAQIARHEGERPAGTNFGRARDPPCAPE